MYVLIAIALKSLIVAGATLGLLQLMKHRSSSERSSVAHIGLLALILLAFAPLVLPSWNVEAPAFFQQQQPVTLEATPEVNPLPSGVAAVPEQTVATSTVPAPAAPAMPILSAVEVTMAAYAVPAAILLAITLLALMRLIALRARADVLVDGHWLSALARAQRRMGFKHGTALLTSNELASPISWGLMRPVILLNNRAVEASGEAEAIIAHELAHVARLDWAKLLLARIATALFWFNPLVWVLAREAHQLREEAADDAVLAADIVDTDYAELLVGVARHECSGLLLGAHGVAPSKSSLARRVARVLDGASARGPVARSFALGVFTGAILIAAPLAALTLTPARSGKPLALAANGGSPSAQASESALAYYPAADETPTDLPSIIADGVSTSVATAAAVVGPLSEDEIDAREAARDAAADAREAAAEAREDALEAAAQAREDAADARQDARERSREAAERAREAAREVRRSTAHLRTRSAVDVAIEMKALGITPEYVSAMRAAAPQLARLQPSEFSGMKAVGVTPDFARGWSKSGFRTVTAEQLTEARAVGLSGDYVRSMIAAGVRGSFDDYVQLRVMGVSPGYVQKLRRSGINISDPEKLVEMQAMGIGAHEVKAARPPAPPKPPRAPAPPAPPRRTGELYLSVSDGVTVTSQDRQFSCSGNSKCRFGVSGNVVLVGAGADEIRWSGCQRLISPNRCEVRIGNGTAFVRAR